jgi:hypothetical protein
MTACPCDRYFVCAAGAAGADGADGADGAMVLLLVLLGLLRGCFNQLQVPRLLVSDDGWGGNAAARDYYNLSLLFMVYCDLLVLFFPSPCVICEHCILCLSTFSGGLMQY